MRLSTRLILVAALYAGVLGCSEPAGTTFDDARVVRYDADNGLQHFLSELSRHYQLPAIAGAVIEADGSVDSSVFGQNKAVGGRGLTPKAIFHLGSCGKSLTSLLAATFVEEGALRWNSTIAEVIPEFRDLIDQERANVTLAELLSHTSGIQPFTSDREVFGGESYLTSLDGPIITARRAFALWVLKQRPASDPGEFSYSNAGYAIVASMLERISDKPYEQLLEERVFEPLALNSAIVGFAVSEDPSEPWRHLERDDNGVGIPLERGERKYPAVLNPAGNISMSIDDFASYVAFHSQGLRGANQVVSAETVAALHRPVVRISDGEQYALGWYIRQIDGTAVSTHSGSDRTIFAIMSIDHSNGRAVAVATNIGGQESEMALVNAILELLH